MANLSIILSVDDDPKFRAAITDTLSDQYNLVTASDGPSALMAVVANSGPTEGCVTNDPVLPPPHPLTRTHPHVTKKTDDW